MSKSKPDSAIFMTDAEEEVERKINKAYCPEGQVDYNPILEYCRYIIFERMDSLTIERPAKYGGNVSFSSCNELEAAFSRKEVHPLDLKVAVAKAINRLLEPVRTHFEKNKEAKRLKEAAESYQVTR